MLPPYQQTKNRRVTGVFVEMVDRPFYKGPPILEQSYFRSTKAASQFLGFKSDAVGKTLSRKKRKNGFKPIVFDFQGLVFMVAEIGMKKNIDYVRQYLNPYPSELCR